MYFMKRKIIEQKYTSKHIHLKNLPTPKCSSLNPDVIRRSRIMKFHYREFSWNHATANFLELLSLIYLSDFQGSPANIKIFQI